MGRVPYKNKYKYIHMELHPRNKKEPKTVFPKPTNTKPVLKRHVPPGTPEARSWLPKPGPPYVRGLFYGGRGARLLLPGGRGFIYIYIHILVYIYIYNR